MSTIFSKIINKEIPAEIVYEDDELLAFNDIKPEDQEIMGKMMLLAKDLARENNIDKSGYRTIFNCNDDGGQTVFHIHLHLIGGRPLNWPPG